MTQSPTRGGTTPLIQSDRQGFDRRWHADNLEAVYVPTTVDEVADCVQAALTTYGSNVKIASGRHCYENFVYNDGTRAVIDMSALNQVGYVPGTGPQSGYFVDAGCENWTVYRTLLNAYGKTLPAGSCYSVGAGGHITGGGYGLLSRLYGLTVDHLSAVDIVTWDADTNTATLRTVSAADPGSPEAELFWALCGAGCGNFGVITRYWFKDLPDAPDEAAVGIFSWDWADFDQPAFARLLAYYAAMMPQMGDNAFSLLKLNHVQAGQIGLVIQVAAMPGTPVDAHRRTAEAWLTQIRRDLDRIVPTKPLRAPLGGHPGAMTRMLDSMSVNHLTYLEALQTLNGSGPNQFGKYKSAYMKAAFPDDQVAAIWEWLKKVPDTLPPGDMAQTLLQVDSYGGAINAIDPAVTAIPQRSSIMKLQFQTYWNNDMTPGNPPSPAQQEQAHLDWMRGFYAQVYASTGGVPDPNDPAGVVDGCYFNYPDVDLGTNQDGRIVRALRLYFKDNLARLRQVKASWDPQNYFCHAQSIPLPGQVA